MKSGASWGKKEKHLSTQEKAQGNKGDQWDHVALARKEKLVVSLVPGKRTQENTRKLVEDFSLRANGGRPPALMTADEYGPYPKCILETYGEEVRPEPTGKPGRPKKSYKVAPSDLLFATVCKRRERGRTVKVEIRLVFGTQGALQEALKKSTVSKRVNVAFVERYNGTDRHLNARKARQTYEFSKNVDDHVHQSWLSVSYYNFCWDHRSLRIRDESGVYQHRSPAMAADITGHIWSMEELATYQVRID